MLHGHNGSAALRNNFFVCTKLRPLSEHCRILRLVVLEQTKLIFVALRSLNFVKPFAVCAA